jgi:sugar phosphate isomerase/epimerase
LREKLYYFIIIKMKLAFSTAWANGDILKLREILPLIDSLEIGTIGDSDYFSSIENLVIKEEIPVTSIHAVAGPFKQEKEAYYTPYFASLDEDIREKDFELIVHTALWARKLGTKLIILHGGKIGDDVLKKNYLALKDKFIQEGESKELEYMRREMGEARRMHTGNHLQNTVSGLTRLCGKFPDITFCFETRLHFHEIPLPHEASYIFETVGRPNLAYWHDIGHTYIMDKLGFGRMGAWQENFYDKCAGIHLHDVGPKLDDHYPPGYGILDIPSILTGFSSKIIPTLEINQKHPSDSVIKGIEYIKQLQP